MNEIQLLRTQLETERAHVRAIAAACAATFATASPAALDSSSPLEEFRQACLDYLVCVLVWFEERDRRLAAQALPGDGADPWAALLAQAGNSRAALERLEAAFAAGANGATRWQEFAQFIDGPWSARRAALEAALAASGHTGPWRRVSGLDADTVLEERSRYARVTATAPASVALPRTGGPVRP
ncbi:MAG TPA: hypothetical protein VMG33_02740 [Steroidobacteraceae bacterium]|nr:hypothetical protein [Steroidobacteraceae bacterium]